MLNTPVQAAAEGMPVSKMTRRAALCGIASISTLGGATAALAYTEAAHPDADLLALGSEFDALRVKSDAAWWQWQALEDTLAEINPAPDRHASAEECNAWIMRRFDYLKVNDTGYEARDAMLDEMDEIAKRVRAIQPKTLAGLAVWGRCLVRDCMNPGDATAPLNEVGWDQEQIRRFVAVLDKMAGGEVAA